MQGRKKQLKPAAVAAATSSVRDPAKVSATWWLNVVLLLIALLPPILLMPSEIDKQWLVGRMRAFDFYDMVLLGPFWMFALFKMNLLNIGLPGRSSFVSVVCACLTVMFFYGHAMHVTGDSINSYMTEVHPEYRDRVPADLYELIYLLDEDLSHLLLFVSIFTLFGLWLYESGIQIQRNDGTFFTGPWPSRIAGAAHGFTCTFAAYETGHPWLGVYSIGWNLFNWWRKAQTTKNTKNYVMVSFALPYCCMLGAGLVAYFLLMGGIMQPSEIGGVFGVLKRARETLGIAHYFSDTVF